MLKIRLLGSFQISYDEKPLPGFHQLRLQALLAYLLLHTHTPQSRQQLAFQFWPDSSEKQAHANLRKLLYKLRNALPNPDHFLRQDHLTVQWRPDATVMVDVAELQKLLLQAGQENKAEALATIAALYQGELLPDCLDEWLLPLRQKFHGAVMRVLEQLVTLAEQQRDYPAGIRYAQQLIGLDPLHEAGYRRLMQLHILLGDRAAALQQYQSCAAILQRELGVDPDEETQAIYDQLLRQARLERRHVTTMHFDTPLVGRTAEWRTLLTAWRQAQRGEAHVVAIAGEAGIGKTRLAEELLAWASAQGIRTARTRLYEADGTLAYAPVTEWLRSVALKPGLPKLSKVWLSEVAHLLPELLTEVPQLSPPSPLSEAWQRQRFFEALARAILIDKSALLLLIDDLQWCDHETLLWLRYLLRFDPQAKLLVIGTWRNDAVDPAHPLQTLLRDLANANQLTPIEVTTLSAEETAALARQLTARQIVNSELQQLYAVTEGHPLFVIETVRSVGEWGLDMGRTQPHAATSNAPRLPPKVEHIIQARLSQLSTAARELVSLAATIGRQFTLAVIAHASQMPTETLLRLLDELWQRRIIRERSANEYDFSHDLLREVAYRTQSQTWRQYYHQRVAEALEALYANEREKVAGQLAGHFEAAALPARALTYYGAAATAAFQLYALQEVYNFCQQGLRLLAEHPRLRANGAGELPLLMMLTAVAVGIQGYGVAAVRAYYERALQLSAQQGRGDWIISIYYGLWLYHFVSAAFDEADRLTEQMPAQAQQLADPFLLELAHHGRGITQLYRGETAAAVAQLTQSLDFAQSSATVGETIQQSQSLTIMTYAFRAMALWLAGYPAQAHQSAQESLQRQAALPTPLNQAASLTVVAMFHTFTRDKAATLAYAERALAVCDQYALAYWRSFAMLFYLWASFDQSADPAQQLAQVQQVLEEIIASGNHASLVYNHHLWIEIQAQAGQVEAAIATLRKTLTLGAKKDERWWEAENYRYLGELLLQRGQVEEAVASLQTALAISRAQGAKAFELRAALTLARYWHGQGNTQEAHSLLSPLYHWFSEGIDTPDLIAAQTLLADITQQRM
jgi:DNA-binding SARP family transcriptional activator